MIGIIKGGTLQGRGECSMLRNSSEVIRPDYLVLVLCIILVTSVAICPQPTFALVESGRVIDLFTQKTPFSGKGGNQSSDAFQPQELVVLYALVTYNEAPVANKLVAFQISGPTNRFQNMTAVGSSLSNQSGVAQFSFRMPWPSENPEEITFGQWFSIATVEIGDQPVVDALTFQVGWIVKITNIMTLNAEMQTQEVFSRQDMIIFNLTVENIAFTEKQAAITIDVQDAASYPIIHLELTNIIFQPGQNHVQASSQIPTTASIGRAIVSAAAYTAPPENGGVLYSPAASATFIIATRDIAVTAVTPSKTMVESGDPVEITVKVRNKGTATETFNVSTYYEALLIGNLQVSMLAPEAETTLTFEWNTSDVGEGFYRISASAPLPGDVNPLDNTYTDGTVQVRGKRQAHDIAVVNVIPSSRLIRAGEVLQVVVTVRNKGMYPESFSVRLYYDHTVVGEKLMTNVAPETETYIIYDWNTTHISPGGYVLSAVADRVEGETQVDDNSFTDGSVMILPSSYQLGSIGGVIFALILGFSLLGSLMLLFLMDFIRRRRRRKTPRLFYTIVSHPHI